MLVEVLTYINRDLLKMCAWELGMQLEFVFGYQMDTRFLLSTFELVGSSIP